MDDLAWLFVDLRVIGGSLPGREAAQGRGGDLGATIQHLQREDQRVATEERMKSARIPLFDRIHGRVRPALR